MVPGFIDTHHHFYHQGLLRNILTNGLLNPDYNRDIGNVLTPAYEPDDVYAGVLITALGMIDMGTTAAVDTSQGLAYARAYADAGIEALQDAGIRAVYALCSAARELPPRNIPRTSRGCGRPTSARRTNC